MSRSFYVIVYDVVSDKRRLKMAKYLESLGDRVQYSVFEVYLTQQELEKLLRKFNKLIDAKEDSVRVYMLCEACRGKIEMLGKGEVTEPPGVVIV